MAMALNISALLGGELAKANPGPGAAASQGATSADSTLFRTLLGLKLSGQSGAAATGTQGIATASGSSAPTTREQLIAQINAQLAKGESLSQIAQTLAANLAQQVGQALGTTDAASLAKLTQSFNNALAPPGSGPPSASALTDRLRHVAAIATGALSTTGLKSRISGKTLDAGQAGGNPAPSLAQQQAASTAAATTAASTTAPATPAASTPNSNGSQPAGKVTVASLLSGALQALSAANVANAPQAPSAPSSAQPQTGSQTNDAGAATVPSASATQPNATAASVPLPVTATGLPAQQLATPVIPGATAQVPNAPQATLTAQPSNPAPFTPFAPPSTQDRVASSDLAAAGTGGGTVLGRTMTRAANAAASFGPNPLSALPTSSSTGSATAVSLHPGADPHGDAGNGASAQGGDSGTTGAQAGAQASAAAASSAAPSAAVSAFLQAFQQSLAAAQAAGTNDGSDPTLDPAEPATAAAPAADTSTANATQSFLASLGIVQNNAPSDSQPTTNPSQSQATSSPQTTDPNDVVDQVVRGISMRDLGTTSEVRLRLVPESLGDISVKLSVDNTTGSVSASVMAHTTEARDTLLANQNQLTRSLADAGLKLSSFTVDLSNSNAGAFAQSGQQQQTPSQRQQPRWNSIAALSGTEDANDDTLDATPSFAPPAPAVVGVGAYNYLV